MAGHSKFKNIMYRKGAQDAKRAKVFTKIAKEIIVAVQIGGTDVSANPRLRSAIAAARAQNMPKDKVDTAIKRGSGEGSGEQYEEIRYEGYGPAGVALIVEALTDNRNRTASDVRSVFNKLGGNLGETGSVSFQFEQIGSIRYPADMADEDAMLEAAIEAGAENCESSEDGHEIACAPDQLAAVTEAMTAHFGEPEESRLSWRPQTLTPVDEDKAATILRLIETLEDSDDVQQVYSNADISDEVMEKLAEG